MPVTSSVFFSSRWIASVAAGLGADPLCISCTDGGTVRAVCPGYVFTRGPFKVFYSAIPYGGVVGSRRGVLSLLNLLPAFLKARGVHRLRIQPMPGHELYNEAYKELPIDIPVLTLEEFAGTDLLSYLNSKQNRGIKRAIRDGVEVRCASHTSDIVEFYSLYKQSMNRNKAISKYALEYFINIFETFGRTGELTYLMAYLRDQAIAGIVVLTSDGWAHYLHGGMDYTFRKHKASDLLFYTAILNALSGGVAYFDYGATSPDDVQLLRYKTKLGSKVAAVPVLEKSINPVRCKVMDGVARVLNFPLFLTLYNKYRSRRM